MNGTQLRNSILQFAIQGKLVPQDPNDEPASVLLERIRKEKEILVKNGKLKKSDLNSILVKEEDFPFSIPPTWQWVNLSQIANTQLGKTKNPNCKGKEFPYLCSINVYWEGIKLDVIKQMPFDDEETEKYVVRKGDMLICEGGDCGRTAIWENDSDILYQNALHRVRFYGGINAYYIKYCLSLYSFIGFLDEFKKGETIKHLVQKELCLIPFPLTPLAEQKRIVAKLEEILPLVESYDKAQQKLDELNETLPDRLRKSILQEAIQGKLVEQDPSDEPASILLERIREEKQKLVKAKVIKADKNESTIYCGEDGSWYEKVGKNEPVCIDEEIPFLIPKMWTWCRLKTIATKLVDGDHNPPSGVSYTTEYLMLSSKNINKDKLVNLNDVRYLTEDVFRKEDERTSAKLGDILFTSVGSLGRSCILNEKLNLCFQRSVSVITTLIVNHYLKRCLDSPFIQSFINDRATGTAQRGFYLNQLEQLLIPIPPLAEQKRIVAKLDELLKHIK